jgi:hypothetical protein
VPPAIGVLEGPRAPCRVGDDEPLASRPFERGPEPREPHGARAIGQRPSGVRAGRVPELAEPVFHQRDRHIAERGAPEPLAAKQPPTLERGRARGLAHVGRLPVLADPRIEGKARARGRCGAQGFRARDQTIQRALGVAPRAGDGDVLADALACRGINPVRETQEPAIRPPLGDLPLP